MTPTTELAEKLESESMSELQAAANTDRELFRDGIDDYYADKIFVTKDGAIGINCVGTVYVKTMRDWHNLAQRVCPHRETLGSL